MKTNRNVHVSGALGRLLSKGQITKIDSEQPSPVGVDIKAPNKTKGNYFKTTSGIEFKENELLYVQADECEPWEYANRQESEMSDIQELEKSIRENQQLQPGLIRPHPQPYGKIKYQIIFGRRRHKVCSNLGIPFLAIKKDITDVRDAIATQDAENKSRKDVSHYSNSILYKKLIEDRVFLNEKDLANKLGMSTSSLNDLMAFTKIPEGIIAKLPNIHELSIAMALKIVQISSNFPDKLPQLIDLASFIGNTITSPAKLEAALKAKDKKLDKSALTAPKIFNSMSGKKLFTLKTDSKGTACIVFDKKILGQVKLNDICEMLKNALESDFSTNSDFDVSNPELRIKEAIN